LKPPGRFHVRGADSGFCRTVLETRAGHPCGRAQRANAVQKGNPAAAPEGAADLLREKCYV